NKTYVILRPIPRKWLAATPGSAHGPTLGVQNTGRSTQGADWSAGRNPKSRWTDEIAIPTVETVNTRHETVNRTYGQLLHGARAGKHLVIEKPLALDWPSCLAMQDAVRQSGVKTVVSFVLHWNPSLALTKSLIAQGAVGQPYYIEVDYWHGMQKWYPQYP